MAASVRCSHPSIRPSEALHTFSPVTENFSKGEHIHDVDFRSLLRRMHSSSRIHPSIQPMLFINSLPTEKPFRGGKTADITQNSVESGNTFERALSVFSVASSDEEKRGESEEGGGWSRVSSFGAELSKVFQRITNSKAPLSFFLERQPLETSPPFLTFSSFLLSVVAVHTSRHAPTHPTHPIRTDTPDTSDTHRHARYTRYI